MASKAQEIDRILPPVSNGAESCPVTVTPAIDICAAITWMSHFIDRFANVRLGSFDLPQGLTPTRIWALSQLFHKHQHGNVTRMSDIAAHLGVTARTATTLVDALESQGLLVRLADPNDRRVTLLDLTQQAIDLMPTIDRAMHDICEEICAPLSEADRTDLLRIFARLIDRD
jgi:DNA-binding MarR family transcriptional regulator